MENDTRRKLKLLGAFLCPVLAGLLFMARGGAPITYIAVNVGALLFLGIIMLGGSVKHRPLLPLAIVGISLALLAATFAGPDIGDVHRWISLGTFKFHAGMLVLPSIAVLLPGLNKQLALSATLIAALLFAGQPDRASAFALGTVCLSFVAVTCDRWTLAAALAAVLAFAITKRDDLLPIIFVEYVVRDAFQENLLIVIFMVGSIAFAALAPILFLGDRLRSISVRAIAWCACLVGYFVASLFGAYPTPLLGYGISSILGFGFALALLFQLDDADNGLHLIRLNRFLRSVGAT